MYLLVGYGGVQSDGYIGFMLSLAYTLYYVLIALRDRDLAIARQLCGRLGNCGFPNSSPYLREM